MKQSHKILMLLFVVSVMARYPFMAQTTDDAFITYRYAENIAAGLGFVYNPGEHILGVTTPLYTLILAFCALIGLKPMLIGPLLNVIADSLVAPILSRRPHADRLMLAPTLYALSPMNAFWSASGMETGLFCCAIALALYFYEKEQLTASAAISAIAVLIRIDAGLLVLVLFVHHLFRRRKMPWLSMLIMVLILAPWTIFAGLYFGNPIPQSVFAKAALPKTGLFDAIVNILIKGFFHPGTPIGALLLISAACAIFWARRELFSAWSFFAAAYILAYTLTRSQLHPWYYPPASIGYLPLAAAGLSGMFQLQRLRRLAPIAFSLLAAASLFGILRMYQRDLKESVALGAFLHSTGSAVGHIAPAGSTLFIKDIGYLGYYSHLRVDDFAGLITPALVGYRARLDFIGAIRHVQSDYLLLASDIASRLEADGWFTSSYETAEIFRSDQRRMVLYRRIGSRNR